MKIKGGVVAGAVVSLLAMGVEAQATRTWVSGVGDDANPCSRTAPCKTFAGAISKTAAGGEINTLDPGGFGAVTITKSITITSESFEAGVLAAGTNGIIVNAASTDRVILKGLDIEGVGTGLNGIRVLQAAHVLVENCRINNFTQRGIDFQPASNSTLVVKDSVILNNTNNPNGGGIFAQGSASATASVFLERVDLLRNFFGIRALGFTKVDVRDSTAVGNVGSGFWSFGSGNPSSMNIEDSQASQNGISGVRSEGAATVVRLSNTVVTQNGILGLHTGSGGQIHSWSNNKIADNPTNGTPNAAIGQQ